MPARCVLFLLLLFVSIPAWAEKGSDVFLFDLLKQPKYLQAWNEMLKGEKVPGWVATYAKSNDGPTSPVTVGPDGTLAWLCKAHDCGDNQLHVLFAPDGTPAWGLLTTPQGQQFLGHPDAAIQGILSKAPQ